MIAPADAALARARCAWDPPPAMSDPSSPRRSAAEAVAANLALWEAYAPVNAKSDFYDVESFKRGGVRLIGFHERTPTLEEAMLQRLRTAGAAVHTPIQPSTSRRPGAKN